MRRMAIAVQRSLLDENDNLAWSVAPVHYIPDKNLANMSIERRPTSITSWTNSTNGS